jgi:hypothetical protein
MDPNNSSLLGSVEAIMDYYIKFFTNELETAILSKNSPDQKADLIRFYISRLMKSINHRPVKYLQSDSQAIITKINEIPPVCVRLGDMLVMNPSSDPNDDRRYKRGCNILYHLLFDELQKCCVTFNIPFVKLCEELGFNLDTINFEYSVQNEKIVLPIVGEGSRSIQAQPVIKATSDHDIQSELIEIMNSENKYWKGLPMAFVVDHFKVMTTTKSINGATFLTERQFINFLRKGFLNESLLPKQHLNFAHGEKGFIIKRFYEFYDESITQYSSVQPQEKIISLFYDCFDNWNLYTIKEFFKRNKVIKKWNKP